MSDGNFMTRGDYIPYSHSDDNPQENARWILGQMGVHENVNYDDSDIRRDDSDSDDSRDVVEYKFRSLPKNYWKMTLKYVRQKSGGGCGSGKSFVPVSCSKKCRYCHGCSPGCGRNYENEK